MKIHLAAACAAITLGLAGAAFADGRVTATLESPAAPAKLIAAHAVFNCAGTSCISGPAPDTAGTLDGCRELAHKVGRLTAYGEFKPLDEKALAKCNTAAVSAPVGVAAQASATVH
ncbi:MAG: hypothetical protein JOZ27_09410 [Caulobacteraceae bacterium]|nr:hypothetical protein [Caulobacteraceae bacterium]